MKFEQLQKIIKGVHSSPQCRQSWAHEILFIQGSGSLDDCSALLMLILNVRTQWASTHQMLRASNVTLLCTSESPVYQMVQDEHSTIMIQLTCLFQATRISMCLSSATLTGSPLSWWPCGSNPSELQQQKCLLQKYQCFWRHMQYFEDYKMTSKLFFAIFQIQFHQILRWDSWMPTTNSVITTTSTTHLPSIHGLHVCA